MLIFSIIWSLESTLKKKEKKVLGNDVVAEKQ